ncbi:hypothetical protein ID866_10989 [Astraeus odoratus]|nr:hypothetical protein ID866_10989 [Astraeus odoratus]
MLDTLSTDFLTFQ